MVTSRDQNGNPLDTNWNITGQENINGTGADVPYPNKPTGSYNISPAVLSGYTGPTITNGQMQTLTANGTITFNLVYTINGYGNSCNSSPNVCGQTNTGTIDGNGNCTASPPPDSQCPAPTADITADNGSVAHNGETTIRWTSQNTSSCTVTNNRNSTTWSGTSGNNLSGKLKSNQSPYVWTATCTGTNGSQVSDSVTVTVGAEPTPVNGVCSSPQLHYSCSAGNLGDNAEYSDSYQWWCNGINGGSNAFCVENKSMPPTVDVSAASTNIAYNTSTTITWTSANTASCTVTPNNWTGTSGSQSTGSLTSNRTYTATCTGTNGSQVSDSVTVTVGAEPTPVNGVCSSPQLHYSCSAGNLGDNAEYSDSYQWWCNGINGGSNAFCVENKSMPTPTPTPTPTPNPPSGDISANPSVVDYGDSSTISWSSSYTTSCTVTPGSWSGTSGSQNTGALTSTTTYTLNCIGTDGSSMTPANTTVSVSLPEPVASSVTESDPDYCVSGPGGFITWSYSDPAGSPQASYRVQITDTGSFNNPIYDSQPINSSSKVYSIPSGVLGFNITYKARVMVWNALGGASEWSNPTSSWKTPQYAYPNVRPPYQFGWTPAKIIQSKPVQFTDNTQFGGGNPNGRIWSWSFGDGNNSSFDNPSHTYSAIGAYQVTETATDADGQSCSYSQMVNVSKPVPVIKEVAPR